MLHFEPTILAVFGAWVAFFAWSVRRSQRRARAASENRRALAERLGLDPLRVVLSSGGLVGDIDGHPVEMSKDAATTTICVAGVPSQLSIRSESVFSAMTRVVDGGDPQIGDPSFDRNALIGPGGSEPDSLCLLSHDVRDRIIEVLRDGGQVLEGRIESRRTNATEEWIEAAVRGNVALAKLLAARAKMTTADALADLVLNDPEPHVRKLALTHLGGAWTSSSAIRDARLKAAKAVERELRRMASWQLGHDDVAVLHELYARDESLDVRASALSRLVQLVPQAERVSLLEHALSPERPLPVLRAALLSVPPGPELVRALERPVLEGRAPRLELKLYADALGRTRAPEAQRALLVLLDERDAPFLQAAAARALGTVGDRDAVEKLLAWSKGVTISQDLKSAARNAIADIQARLGGEQAGQLAISEDEQAGALSEAEKPGALSIAKKQAT